MMKTMSYNTGRNYGTDQVLTITYQPMPADDEAYVAEFAKEHFVHFKDSARGIEGTVRVWADDIHPATIHKLGSIILRAYDQGLYKEMSLARFFDQYKTEPESEPEPEFVTCETDSTMSFGIVEGQLVRSYCGRPETAWHLFKNGDPDDVRIESVKLIEPFGIYLLEIQHSGSYGFNVMIGNSTNHYDTAVMIGDDQIILSVIEE